MFYRNESTFVAVCVSAAGLCGRNEWLYNSDSEIPHQLVAIFSYQFYSEKYQKKSAIMNCHDNLDRMLICFSSYNLDFCQVFLINRFQGYTYLKFRYIVDAKSPYEICTS